MWTSPCVFCQKSPLSSGTNLGDGYQPFLISRELAYTGYTTELGKLIYYKFDIISILAQGNGLLGYKSLEIDDSVTDFAFGSQITWNTSTNGACGIDFRIPNGIWKDNDYYSFFYFRTPVPTFALYRMHSDNYQNIVITGSSPYIYNGQGTTNGIIIIAKGDEIQIFMNGYLLLYVKKAMVQSGEFVLLASSGKEKEITTCSFTKNWVWGWK